MNVLPVVSTVRPIAEGPTRRSDVVQIVVKALPMPGDNHSLEDVIAFRDEARAHGTVQGLHAWMHLMASGSMSPVEVSDRLEDLVANYERALKLERMSRTTGLLDTSSPPRSTGGSATTAAPANTKRDLSTMAIVQCQNYVRNNLRSPSTADFPFLDRPSVNAQANDTYIVRSYVDAQNAFGATVRNNWVCRIRYTSGEAADQSNWTLEDLQMAPN